MNALVFSKEHALQLLVEEAKDTLHSQSSVHSDCFFLSTLQAVFCYIKFSLNITQIKGLYALEKK